MSITSIKKETPRDRWGRPLVVPPEGGKPVPYTRCTTFVGCLEDTYNLSRWQQRMVAIGLSERADLLLQMSTLDRDDKKAINALCEQAMEAAKAHAAATIGTALHALSERVDRGEDLGVIPEAYKADIDAYADATRELTAVHIEQFTVLDDLKIGGTPDRVVEHDGKLKIADVKTGSIEWGMGKIAMQLAVYAHSQTYDFDTGTRSDIGPVDLDEAIVIHLPAGQGKAELVSVDIAAGWEAVQLASQVRAWRARKDLARPLAAQTPLPEPAPVNDDLANRIASAATVDELGQIWTERHQDFTPEHIELAGARKRLLTEAVA